jgi:hypothetical protein
LVICSEDANTEKCTFWSRGISYVFKFFYNNISVKGIWKKLNEVKVYDSLKVYLLELPCTKLMKSYELAVVSKKCDVIFAAIEDIRSKKGIEMFYLSKQLLNISYFRSYYGEFSTGKLLFQALIIEILGNFYSNKADISKLDIVVIQGENEYEVVNLIRMLYPVTKFITVLTQDKTWFENELEDIYIKTGLSISVMSDFEKGLKNADIIICYGDINKITAYTRLIKRGAMILHYIYDDILYKYGSGWGLNFLNRERYSNITELDLDNILINDLEIHIPPSIIMKLGNLIPKHFNSLELAEILIKSQISLPVNAKQRDPALQDLARVFNEGGYYIKQFKGFKLNK